MFFIAFSLLKINERGRVLFVFSLFQLFKAEHIIEDVAKLFCFIIIEFAHFIYQSAFVHCPYLVESYLSFLAIHLHDKSVWVVPSDGGSERSDDDGLQVSVKFIWAYDDARTYLVYFRADGRVKLHPINLVSFHSLPLPVFKGFVLEHVGH